MKTGLLSFCLLTFLHMPTIKTEFEPSFLNFKAHFLKCSLTVGFLLGKTGIIPVLQGVVKIKLCYT